MKTRTKPDVGATLDTVRALALALSGVVESTSYGTPAFKAGGKLLARLHQDGESLVIFVDPDARDLLMRSEPETFFITDHYVGYPDIVLVRLARASRASLSMLLEEAWRSRAPKRLVAGGKAAKLAEPAPAKGKPAPAARAKKAPAATPGHALERLRAICLALPETAEGLAHGRPCFTVRGKTFVMFLDDHHGDGRLALWCKAPPGAQAALVESSPERFFVPPYVGPRGWIGARLEASRVDWGIVASCVEESHRMSAPRRAAAAKAPRRRA